MGTFNPILMMFEALAPWLFSGNYKKAWAANCVIFLIIVLTQCGLLGILALMAGVWVNNPEWGNVMPILALLLSLTYVGMFVHAVEEVGIT